MADVTISALTRGTPAGNNVVPYSTGTDTLGTAVSAMFHNAGNVGIGTAAPAAKLDVNGDVKANNIPKFAWARFDSSGQIQASLGVTSITKPIVASYNIYRIDVTAAAFSNANYSVTGMTRYNGTSNFMQLYTGGSGEDTTLNPTTTVFYVATNNPSIGVTTHTNYIQVMGN